MMHFSPDLSDEDRSELARAWRRQARLRYPAVPNLRSARSGPSQLPSHDPWEERGGEPPSSRWPRIATSSTARSNAA
jgi:hypothetical protein